MAKRTEGVEMLTDEDLLTEVLSRLPVKYLLQCKAVSKPWYSLISSPNFIKSHYQRHAITINRAVDDNNEQAPTLIVRLFKGEDLDDHPEEDGSYSLYRLGATDNYIAKLNFPFSRGDYPFTPPSILVGCVCGIVCVCVDPSASIDANYFFPTADKATDIYIWNPTARQSKLIPSHALYNCDDKVALGFGFDPVDFDFKVVRVVSRTVFPEVYSAERDTWRNEVYSAERDTWRNIETKLIDIPYNCRFDICLHGFLFATGYSGMVAFNLNKEVFICDIKLPINCKGPRKCYDARIVDFKDSIAVMFSNDEELRSGKINLWILDDEACLRGGGVEASWTFMLNIDVGKQLGYLKGLFNNVEFLLIYGEWISYNYDRKVVRYIRTYPLFDYDDVFKYTESQQMLLVTGSKMVNWSDDKDVESSVDLEEMIQKVIMRKTMLI
ncbi:F-box protein At1g30790-like [Daucus carota subsp. sativus]|uniref:F-box protein At1g30790-like n=1 Tax=Daucus carota subsp. sativus TaxID=79200 RepID=UPI0007EF2302|nr:PREDICTED: F-box protein At1g30790-like [Daucus carota subsp. sativus]